MKKAWSLRAKVQAMVIAAVGLGFAVSMVLLTQSAANMQQATAMNHVTELAQSEAQRVSLRLEKALQSTRALALSIDQLRKSGHASRALVDQLLEGGNLITLVFGRHGSLMPSTAWTVSLSVSVGTMSQADMYRTGTATPRAR